MEPLRACFFFHVAYEAVMIREIKLGYNDKYFVRE